MSYILPRNISSSSFPVIILCTRLVSQFIPRFASVLMSRNVQQFSNWNCILGMYIDDPLMGGDERETYFHVISDRRNYPLSAMIAVRGLALQSVAQSPTIILTHFPVCEALFRSV
jgi:hypothetical protein